MRDSASGFPGVSAYVHAGTFLRQSDDHSIFPICSLELDGDIVWQMWHSTGSGAEHQMQGCSPWAPLQPPLTHREGSYHCSLKLCYLWLSVVNEQLVLGLQVHGVAAREVTAGLLIYNECQKYLLSSGCLCSLQSMKVCQGVCCSLNTFRVLCESSSSSSCHCFPWNTMDTAQQLWLQSLSVSVLPEKPRTPSCSWPWVSMSTSLVKVPLLLCNPH